MVNTRLLSLLLAAGLLTATSAGHAAATDADYFDVRQKKPYPVIKVTPGGDNYTSAGNQPIKYLMEGKGRCKWGYRVTWISRTLDADQSNGGAPSLTGESLIESPNAKNRTWASSWTPVDLNWNPNNAVRNKAVQACNSELNKRVSQGQNRNTVLAHGFTTEIQQYYLGLHMTCADYGLVSGGNHRYVPAKVAVQCDAKTLPMPAQPIQAQAVPQLQLNFVTLQANPQNYQGICPADINFTGTIQTNGVSGQVQYRFLKDGQPVGKFQNKALPGGPTSASVNYSFKATNTQANAQQGPQGFQQQGFQQQGFQQQGPQMNQGLQVKPVPVIELEVKHAQQLMKVKANYSYSCKTLAANTVELQQPQAPVSLPDVTSRQGITIGSQSSAWGGYLQLNANDSTLNTPRGCQYRMKYDVVNIGGATAEGFNSVLFEQGAIHTETNMNVGKGASKNASGNIILPAGQHQLTARIDHPNKVAETKEDNNQFSVTVTVPESCGTNPAPTVPPRRPAVPIR